MAFSGPSPTLGKHEPRSHSKCRRARVKPVPPPKPLSPSVPISPQTKGCSQQKERQWEILPSLSTVADSQCVKPQKELNLDQGVESDIAGGSNPKAPPSRLSSSSKTSHSVSWKIAQEDNVVTPPKPSPIGASPPRGQFPPKFPVSVPSAGDNTRPPLLPKPSSLAARNAPKPPIPKRPDASFLARRTIQESGTQTPPFGKAAGNKQESLGKLNISRASVANNQHFENAAGKESCSSPIRPPRSPKNKPFSGMPFDFVSTRQNLSSKQKILSLPHGERQKSFLWSYRKFEPVSPDVPDKLCCLSEIRAKSCSLERNTTLFTGGSAAYRLGIRFKDPIPPPRRVKKKSPVDVEENPFLSGCQFGNNNIPEYAVVNYELKKNRRVEGVTGVGTDVPVSSHEATTESYELSPSLDTSNLAESAASDGIGCSCDLLERSSEAVANKIAKCTGSDVSLSIAPKCPCGWEEEHVDCNTKNVINGGEDSKAAIEDARFPDKEVVSVTAKSPGTLVTLETNVGRGKLILSEGDAWDQASSGVTEGLVNSVVKDFPSEKGESFSFSITEPIRNQHLLEDVKSEMVTVTTSTASCFERGSISFQEVDQDSKITSSGSGSIIVINKTKSLETKIIDKAQLSDCDNAFYNAKNTNSHNVVDIDIGESELDHSSKSTLVVTREQSSISSEASPLPLDLINQGKENLRKTSSESDCSPWADALESKRSDEDDDDVDYGRNESSTLPMRSRLNARHDGSNDQSRRQSWSDGQKKENSSGGWSGPSKQRRKRRGRSLWCDEGDLSSGTLGDQSSFEDVPVEEKSGESSNVRRRLSALFSSFGKNSRKCHSSGHKQKEKKVRVISRFHCELDDNGSNLKVEKPSIEAKSLDAYDERVPSVCQTDREEVKEMGERLDISEDGMSRLCEKLDSLDLKRQSGEFGSGSHFSEQSFDNAPSESENEEMLLPEENADRSLSEAQRREKKRFYIAQELMSSERVFVDALRLLCIDFRTAVSNAGMEQKIEIISDADLGKILHNLPQLLSFNEELLQDLEERISNWNHNQKISDIIVRKGPFLKLYTSYFQNFETQRQYLDDCCDSNARFARVIRDFEASPRCQKLALRHFMLKPIQRLPQYRLLLEDYLSKLDPESTDYEDTKVALAIVCDVADHANRSMKQGDALSKLLQLQSLLKNYAIIKPGRTFLKEGELQKLCRKGMQNRYFILLNDCLLYASVQAPGSLKVNNELPLDGMKVEIPVAEDYTNEFSIISITRSFTLSASSVQERAEWVNALQKAIQDYTLRQQTFLQMKLAHNSANQMGSEHFQLGTAAPVWIQDCRVTMCQSCTSEFTVTFRRHHCRACGKVVCGKCSANKAPLQYMKYQAARVCDECFDSLLQDFEKNPQEAFQREFGHAGATIGSIRASFKKLGQPAGGKKIKYRPQRLKEVCANDTGSQMSGWLQYRCRRSWKKMWFVLKDQVLYVYKASEDVVALESIPILGYQVHFPCELENMKQDEVENGVAFSLMHKGKQFLEFQADNVHSSKRWRTAMQEATVLK